MAGPQKQANSTFRLPHMGLFIHFTHNKTVPNQHVMIIETARQGGKIAKACESSYFASAPAGALGW